MTDSNSYHHGALKETLLNSALDKLAAGQSVTEISIRALAAEAGVSKGAPRRHFASADDLIAALAERGFQQLTAQMDALKDADLTALGVIYVRFALDHPQLYRSMFHFPREQAARFPGLVAASGDTYQRLRRVIEQRPQRQSALSDDQASLTAWALVHGLADLLIQQHTHQSMDDAQIRASLSGLISGL